MPTEPTKPERFDIYCWCGHRVIHSAEPEGEWIRLEDYAALQSAHEALSAKLDALVQMSHKVMDAAEAERASFYALKEKLREYLVRPSTDGRPDRMQMRAELSRMIL